MLKNQQKILTRIWVDHFQIRNVFYWLIFIYSIRRECPVNYVNVEIRKRYEIRMKNIII